jgi:hypothetical protein
VPAGGEDAFERAAIQQMVSQCELGRVTVIHAMQAYERGGFYETAGGVKRFLFFPSLEVFAFVFVLVGQIHLRLLYALNGGPFLARCLLGPDGDESGLLSEARPMTAKPPRAVTRTRDGF